MSLMDRFKPLNEDEQTIDPTPYDTKRVQGKIIIVHEEGYGFIISQAVPFRRIFFHWTFLEESTKKFEELEEGMKVEFKPIEIPGKGWRAIKIKVLD